MIPTDSAKEAASQEFRLIGGAWQPVVADFEQLKAVLELDEAFWALNCIEINSLRMDRRFLNFMDSNNDGKIRTDEIREAVTFLLTYLCKGGGCYTIFKTL